MKTVLTVIKNILVWLLVVAVVAVMVLTVSSALLFDKNDRDIFGYKFFVVQTDSMSATDFSAGDIIIDKTVDPATLKEGDIITFVSISQDIIEETGGSGTVTHKIRTLTTDGDGRPGFITYGTTTGVDDDTVVTYECVVGKYVAHMPAVGSFFAMLKTPAGYIVCIFVPFMILILYQGIKVIRLFRQYKREQSAMMEEERRKIEEERKQSEEMLQKLQALQAQLAQQGVTAPDDGADPPPQQPQD